MGETEAQAQGQGQDRAAETVSAIGLARDFMARRSDPLALLRKAGAQVDESFAGNGSYPFEAPGVAARGSTLAIDARPDEVAPETLQIVLPAERRLTLEAVAAALGTPARLPALPGTPWLYTIPAAQGRYSITLDGDPARAARVVSITAIRER